MSIWFELLIVILLILLGGLFALSESAVVSSRKLRLQQRSNEGDDGAQAALQLSENPSAFIATARIGTTSMPVLASAFGGVTIANWLTALLADIPALQPYAYFLSLFISVSISLRLLVYPINNSLTSVAVNLFLLSNSF